MQPLDISFFSPVKVAWHKILTDWKMINVNKVSIPKRSFASLFRKLHNKISPNSEANTQSGFKSSGIAPKCRGEVLKKLPNAGKYVSETATYVKSNLKKFLQQLCYKNYEVTIRARVLTTGLPTRRPTAAPGESVGEEPTREVVSSSANITHKRK